MAKNSVGSHTLSKLRSTYLAWVGQEWPHNNAYLKQLWAEARASCNEQHAKVPSAKVWDAAKDLMRECHDK